MIEAIFWDASLSWAGSRPIIAQAIQILSVWWLGSYCIPSWAAGPSRCIFIMLDPAHVCSTWRERWKPLLEATMAVPWLKAILIADSRLVFTGLPFRCALCCVRTEYNLRWSLLLLWLLLRVGSRPSYPKLMVWWFSLLIKAISVFSDCFTLLQYLPVGGGYKSRHHNLLIFTGTGRIIVMWLHLIWYMEILNWSECTPLRALPAVSYRGHRAIILVLRLYAVSLVQMKAGKVILWPVDWQHASVFCKFK